MYQTLSFLFQYSFCSYSTCNHVTNVYIYISFQYSFCSYSTITPQSSIKIIDWFQYSFCSYSTRNKMEEKHPMSFNTASVLIQHNHCWKYSDCTRVSIQLLFLFNIVRKNDLNLEILFQYSFCSYSTIFRLFFFHLLPVSIQLLFLFNGITRCTRKSSCVSIQLLFLFNILR